MVPTVFMLTSGQSGFGRLQFSMILTSKPEESMSTAKLISRPMYSWGQAMGLSVIAGYAVCSPYFVS
jgi:hypothetical protein